MLLHARFVYSKCRQLFSGTKYDAKSEREKNKKQPLSEISSLWLVAVALGVNCNMPFFFFFLPVGGSTEQLPATGD